METRTCKRHGEQLIDAYYKYVARTNSAGEPIYSYRCRLCAAESDVRKRERKRTGKKLEEKPRYFCSKHGQLTSDDFRKQKAFEYKGKPIYKDKCKLCDKEYLERPEVKDRRRKWARHWGRENKEKRLEYNKQYLESHPEKAEQFRESRKRRREVIKTAVFQYYGGDPPKCACCGESHLGFLCIDHIDGGGNKHRRKLGKKTHSFWLWLMEQNFPDGYRVLCHNCNFAIGAYGHCCHEDDVNMKG